MDNKICIYAISKNEEQFVDRWYESMKEADSIVVLDTGSTDGTVEKLKSHGVTVEQKIIDPWRFDVARNESLKLVPQDCDILFCTDLDEILEPGWAKVLKENWVESKHTRGCYMYTWSHNPDGSEGRTFLYNKIHNKEWEWKYPVHELLALKSNRQETLEETLYLGDKIHLHHYPDLTKSRQSYLPLLELRAEQDPDDWYGLIYLAQEYHYRGFYQKSIDKLKYILENFKEHYNSVEQASCYLFMGDSYRALNENQQAKNAYIQCIQTDSSYREGYLGLAKILLEEKKYDLAISVVRQGLLKSVRHYSWLERDTSWSYEPYDLLSLAAYYGGYKRDSIAYAAKALEFAPNDMRLKRNLELCVQNANIYDMVKK